MLHQQWLAGLRRRPLQNANKLDSAAGQTRSVFSTHWLVWLVCLTIIVAHTGWGAARAYPFVDDINPIKDWGDDWLTYKENALSIVQGGLLMPRVSGAYAFPIPGGFLYNYFVAAVFALAGPNPAYVYVVQGALLGLGSAVMTLAVASSLPLALRVAYALTLGVYMGIDTFHLTRQLLSENLSLLLLPVGVALALRLRDRPAPGYWAGAGAVWGLAALARPETIPLGPALALLTAGAARSRRLAGPLAAFLLAFALVFSFWPLRNLLVTERLDTSVGAITSYVGTALKPPSDAESGGPDLGAIWRYYSASVLYVMGIPQFIDPVYRVRPHWWLMWGLFAVAVGAMVVRRRIVFSDLVILAVVVLYLGPLLLGAHVYSYGYRSVAPAVPFVLLFSFKGLEVLLQRYRRAQPQRAPAGS